MADVPSVRASDAEREQVVALLRAHSVDGRLTLEELAQRVDAAYAATTRDELERVTADLPAGPPPRSRRRPKRLTAVIFGSVERTGRWRMPRRKLVVVLFGNADVDLRRAELTADVASLTAIVLFGNVDVYVPQAVDSDVGGISVFGHRREFGPDAPTHPGTPLVRVRVLSLFGTADVWRVPAELAASTFREVIRGLRSAT
jgi:hypothetical protein